MQSTYNSKTAPNIVVVLRSQPHTVGLHTFCTDKVTLLLKFLCHVERSVKRASHGRDQP